MSKKETKKTTGIDRESVARVIGETAKSAKHAGKRRIMTFLTS